MKYIKKYKLFESSGSEDGTKYYISGNYWDYQLGYLWSPKVNIGGSKGVEFHSRNDSSVNRVDIKNDGMSNTLANRTVLPLFQEHFGTSNLNNLCEFDLQELGYDYGPMNEFSFLEKGLIEKRCYVNIKMPGKPDIIQQVPDFKENYLDLVGRIIGHTFTDKERRDIEDGKDTKYYSGLWFINIDLYDVNGIKIIFTDMFGSPHYILKRSELEKLIDMTSSYNYYRFVDKDLQVERVDRKRLEYNDISDIFVDVTDSDINKINMEDFHQINENQMMIKFMTTNMIFDKELVDALSDNINRFTAAYGFNFNRVYLTLNHMMYINDSNKTWLLKDRPVYSYKELDKLMGIGEMQNELHLKKHAMYIIFNIK
jgi:hypothetical protein